MKICSTIRITETDYVSENCIWSTKTTRIYRTIFGKKLWLLKAIRRVYKAGDCKPYVAKPF
jgi:hypothetical protein